MQKDIDSITKGLEKINLELNKYHNSKAAICENIRNYEETLKNLNNERKSLENVKSKIINLENERLALNGKLAKYEQIFERRKAEARKRVYFSKCYSYLLGDFPKTENAPPMPRRAYTENELAMVDETDIIVLAHRTLNDALIFEKYGEKGLKNYSFESVNWMNDISMDSQVPVGCNLSMENDLNIRESIPSFKEYFD